MTLQDAIRGFFGAWRLLHFDRTGLQYFQVSPAAFWHSFWAAAIVLPADAIATLLLLSGDSATSTTSDTLHTTLIYLEIYALQWLIFPLVIAGYTEMIQRSDRFVLFVIAWNWSSIIRAAIVLPAIAIFANEGTDSASWGAAIYIVALGVTFVYGWFVARSALDAPPLSAAMVVVIEIVLAILIWAGAQNLIGQAGAG
jgi:hypothetical protein